MTLLNGLLAFGALAFTVPLTIHLLYRNRFRTLDWGAMHLLENVIRINRRRMQLMHLLLLLLRCLLPVLLAFCLARPVLTGFRVLPGDAPRSVVVALDDSQSMAAREESGQTRIELAKGAVTSLLKSLSRRDEVILVRASHLGTPVAASGAQEAIESLKGVRASSGPVNLADLLRAAINASGEAAYPQRQIIAVSDFASNTLDDATLGSLSNLAESLSEKSLPPTISFLNLGQNSDELQNLSVDTVESKSPAVVAGRGGGFTATVRNASDSPIRDVRLAWMLDGAEISRSTLTIAARSTTVARLTHRIDDVGVHALAVVVEHADAVLEDNRRSLAIDVIDEIDVLLVDGAPSQEPLEGETDYLAIALSPFAFGGDDQPDAVRTQVCMPRQLQKQMELVNPDLVVLANVAELSKEEKSVLTQFVLRGGTMLVFDGDLVASETYNTPWECAEGSWLLPARLGETIGEITGEDRLPQPSGMNHAIYSPWDMLSGGNDRPFAEIDVYAYRKLLTPAAVEAEGLETIQTDSPETERIDEDANTMTLWSLGNGDPVAVLARRGRGKVVQFAIPCDTAWSTLPLRLIFLPMIQQLVLDLAGNQNRVNVAVGDGIVVPAKRLEPDGEDAAEIDTKRAAEYRLETPDRVEVVIKPTEEIFPRLLVASAVERGLYRFRCETPMLEGLATQTETLRLAEMPAQESILRDADLARIESAAESVDATIYNDITELQQDDSQRRFGREIWRWLLGALLLVLVAELFLQQHAVGSSQRPREKAGAL
ncbi:BatA domain-containing protein [Rubripirellula sp.]|nr:BatA domain-containing protein [Rubripirellula sp.]MDB4339048.1 BatA domain-containing protein [Rubripirellula sp.]